MSILLPTVLLAFFVRAYSETNNSGTNMSQGKIVENELFVSRLSSEMQSKSLTQSDLAFMSKISQGTISAYVLGKRSPGAAELGRLSDALGVSMGWLWGIEEENSRVTNEAELENKYLRGKIEMLVRTMRSAIDSVDLEEFERIPTPALPTPTKPFRSIVGDDGVIRMPKQRPPEWGEPERDKKSG